MTEFMTSYNGDFYGCYNGKLSEGTTLDGVKYEDSDTNGVHIGCEKNPFTVSGYFVTIDVKAILEYKLKRFPRKLKFILKIKYDGELLGQVPNNMMSVTWTI